MSTTTTLRWPKLRMRVTVPACKHSLLLRPGQRVPNHQPRTTTTSFVIMRNYGHLQMRVPARLDRLSNQQRKHHRKPIRSVTRRPRLMRLSTMGRSRRTTTQPIAEHRPTPRYLRCQKWHRNRHDSASLQSTMPTMVCSPRHLQVIQRLIHRTMHTKPPVLLVVRASPMHPTGLLPPPGRCCLRLLV